MTTFEDRLKAAPERRRFVMNKNGQDFFPWALAWAWLKRDFPSATWGALPPVVTAGVVGVKARVWLRLEPETEEVVCDLAVTDMKNKTIPEPTAADVDNAEKRALVKAIAIATGIGLELWIPSMRGQK